MRRAICALIALAGALALSGGAVRAADAVTAAIVFAVDVSGSVNAERYELQRAGIAEIFESEGVEHVIGDGLAVSVMQWSDGHDVVIPWTILRTPDDAHALGQRMRTTPRSPGISTELSLALFAAADLLAACPCDAKKYIIDVSGDGPNNGPVSTYLARDQVIARGIRINGLPIVTPQEPELAQWYRDNVIGGYGAFVVIAHGYEDFARAMRRKFLTEVAGPPNVLRERTSVAAVLPNPSPH
ncbi:MAG TPA: DUF1194 domain-containing protein [Candidatus Cybelea sp.]|nr:DUF1194 domain-containing protein [Candidatus Cybelea sp.]